MATRSYRARGIVVRKTKLRESDVIVTFLAEDGSPIRAVAKGARKPGGAFSSRLELLSTVEVLLAKGKSLDIVQEARVDNSHAILRSDAEKTLCALPVAELIEKTMQDGLDNERLFPLFEAFLENLELASAKEGLALCGAAILKIMAYLGFKPSLSSCVECGRSIDLGGASNTTMFSYVDGGAVCDECKGLHDVVGIATSTLSWVHFLLYATFKEIAHTNIDETASFSVLQFSRFWIAMHAGVKVKSLEYLMTSEVFDSDAIDSERGKG